MASPKLFDYNSSFGLLRTNPKLTGNVKVSLDSSGGVWLNSFNANPTLSSERFKKFQVTGKDSYATDIYNFFDKGTLSNDLIFQVGEFTDGSSKAQEDFEFQYDFFYGSGASTLIDKNYTENFRYFQPLWLRNELPEFFVIFKIPEPLSYPYTTNVTRIKESISYKLIQDPDSAETFQIAYGKDNSGLDILYKANQIFEGVNLYSTYQVVSGSGKVVEMNELKFQNDVDDVEGFFNAKILPHAKVIATYDLRSETKIGQYIRGVVNNKNYKKSPIDFSFQQNTYTYYNGVSVKDGVFTERGELLYDYLVSPQASIQSDFENYVTDGFQRNGVVCPNVLNMEFLFNDPDSDLYTINRYFGFYVSKNDLGEFFLNGDYFFNFKNSPDNLNLPKPSRNNLGHYEDNRPNFQSSTGGVRLYYEGASGWIPGSYDTNVNDPQKLYYITDKSDNFYSLKRFENYNRSTKTWENNTPEYATYGPYNNGTFGVTGNVSLPTGSIVIGNKSINLQAFTGYGDKIGSIKGILPGSKGRANIGIEFLTNEPLNGEVVFKLFWPNGTRSESAGRYDLVKTGEFGGTLVGWKAGSSYNIGNNHYFNAIDGKTKQIASAFCNCVNSISDVVWDSAPNSSTSVIRTKASGTKVNSEYRVVIYDDYASFEAEYVGLWNNTSGYSTGDVVMSQNNYYKAKINISPSTPGSPNADPSTDTNSWETYSTFSQSGFVKIAGVDASALNGAVSFSGGTDYALSRVSFGSSEKDKVVVGNYIEVKSGTGVTGGASAIETVTPYVDDPIFGVNGKVTGFNGYDELLTASLKDQKAVIDLGTSQSFNLYEMPKIKTGVFSFFDIKDFDFDFWSSSYGETPTPEFHRYFQLIPEVNGQIKSGVKYIVQSGEILVDKGTGSQRILTTGQAFIGTSVSYFEDIGLNNTGATSIVVPAIFTQSGWKDTLSLYKGVKAEKNLDAFDGFFGIQSINETQAISQANTKEYIFNYGKLDTEYEYLEENYTAPRANRSKIVPFINKWGYFGGTDARGHSYRLNASPAFSPTNFSPSFEKEIPDPMYLTHEWMLLEGVPDGYPSNEIEGQNSYLPSKIDLSKIRSANPADALYFSSFLTVEPADYPSPYNISKNTTKELFTPFVYNKSTGFYDTVFRGAKISLRRRSTVANPQSALEKYVPNYRGFEDYKFASILRVEVETTNTIQSPVSYEIIENTQQKCVLFVCTVVIKDYRAFPLGYTGGTGSSPYLDYTLLYSLSDKKRDAGVGTTGSTGATGSPLYEIDDIKLSAALDLSISSSSSVTEFTNPGFIYTIPNSEYDTDLREEINTIYPVGGTGSLSPTGKGSFSVPAISSTYPWPIGRSKNLASFGPVGTNYTFTIPFAFSSPVTVPVGPKSAYQGNPVFQVEGGEKYFDFIMRRISLSQISDRVNNESPFIKYRTYSWDEETQTTEVRNDYFQFYMQKPTALFRSNGTFPVADYSGPQTLGQNQPTGYQINVSSNYAADILRYAGKYEPLFKKVMRYKNDKTDTITGFTSADLSYRNCTFAPEKSEFGKLKNLNYSKVSLGRNILEKSDNLPLGPVYPLVGETPIAKKDFSVFLSTWDPGYFNLFTSATQNSPVAGTRSMRENKSFFGSKMMQTPYTITSYTFITLEVNRNSGETDIQKINVAATRALQQIQSITPQTSNTGIGQLGTVLSSVDLPVFDEGIYPDVEVFWQKDTQTNKLYGSIRLDRILRRFLLNSGISKVFVENIISEFGVGDPENINDDIKTYIDKNIVPIYQGITFDLFVKKTGTDLSATELLLRGDLVSPDRIRYSYYQEPNYKLTKRNALSYSFELPMESGKNYSTTFTFQIEKI